MTIPSNPAPGREWTNDATGVTYVWNGERWLIVDNTADVDLTGYVTEPVFTADQQRQDDHDGVQDNQINALETQVQLLAGVKAVGRWTYRRRVDGSPRPPTLRTFYGTDIRDISNVLTSWENTNLLMISKTDLDDNTYTFSDFEEGDKVEVIAKDGSSAVYGTVTNNPNSDSYGNFVIDVERWRGGPVEEAEYLISAYRPGTSSPEVDLDILDGRYLVKSGDTMTGDLNFQEGNTPSRQFSIDPNSSTSDTNIISLLNGQMRFRTTHTDNIGDRVGSHIVLDPNGGTPQTKIYNVIEPTNDLMPANKQYVDDKVIKQTLGLPFRQQSGNWDDDVDSGYFRYAYRDSTGKFMIRISNQTWDGWKWNSTPLTPIDIEYNEGHRYTIYSKDSFSNDYRIITTGTYNRTDYHNDDVLVYVSYQQQGYFPTSGVTYYLKFSGMF